MKKKILKGLLVVALAVSAVTGWIVYQGYEEYTRAIAERPVAQMFADEMAEDDFVYADQLPEMLKASVIATEDARFMTRWTTLDYIALSRATLRNIQNLGYVEGGSTIPQQIAKNFYFGDEMTLRRKVAEYFVARDMLKAFSKEEILAIYINMNYYGDGYDGLEAATHGYFGVDPIDLTDAQATILAGIPQAPSHYQLSTNYDGAKARQRHVLNRLVKTNVITEARAQEIYDTDIYGG